MVNVQGKARFSFEKQFQGKFQRKTAVGQLKFMQERGYSTNFRYINCYFTKYAETVPCKAHEYTAWSRVGHFLTSWCFCGTLSIFPYDYVYHFIAVWNREFIRLSHVKTTVSEVNHSRPEPIVERQNGGMLFLLSVHCKKKQNKICIRRKSLEPIKQLVATQLDFSYKKCSRGQAKSQFHRRTYTPKLQLDVLVFINTTLLCFCWSNTKFLSQHTLTLNNLGWDKNNSLGRKQFKEEALAERDKVMEWCHILPITETGNMWHA